MAKPVHEVAVALVYRNGKWLVARRPRNTHLGGYWEFPGGKRHVTEPPAAAALRELREECDVVAIAQRELPMLVCDYDDRIVELTPVLCRWEAGEGRPLGCDECRWASRRQIAELRMPPVNAELLRYLDPDA